MRGSSVITSAFGGLFSIDIKLYCKLFTRKIIKSMEMWVFRVLMSMEKPRLFQLEQSKELK